MSKIKKAWLNVSNCINGLCNRVGFSQYPSYEPYNKKKNKILFVIVPVTVVILVTVFLASGLSDSKVAQKEKEISECASLLESSKNEVLKKEDELKNKEKEIADKNNDIALKEDDITYKEKELVSKQQEINVALNKINIKEENLKAKDVEILLKQTEINNRNKEVQAYQEEIKVYFDKIGASKEKEAECKAEMENLKKENSRLSNESLRIKSELNVCASKSDSFKATVGNSARDLCCSFADFQKGAVKNWGMDDNSIVCSGEFTINCATGVYDWKG